MYAALNDELKKPSKKRSKKVPIGIISKADIKGRNNFHIYNKKTGNIIGHTNYGSQRTRTLKRFVKEYEERRVFNHLMYAWSGHGYCIYNIKNNSKIGDYNEGWKSHPYLHQINEYLDLDLIGNAVRASRNTTYVCSFNALGTLSAYDSMTGQNILPEEYFATVFDCVTAINKHIKT
jgi:hypothetical protein